MKISNLLFLKNMSFQQQLGHLYDPFSLQGSGNTTEEEVERKTRSQSPGRSGAKEYLLDMTGPWHSLIHSALVVCA